MSKRANARFIANNKTIDKNQSKYRKCVYHIHSQIYTANMKQHDEIVDANLDKINAVDMDSTINIKIALHFLAPKGTFNRDRVLTRAHELIMSLNDDFNNYSSNPNTMNNFKYKSIINQVFISNMPKQSIYLGAEYLKFLPTKPSNITFELGEIYYYPIKNRLSLASYDDNKDTEIEMQVIKQYIHQSRANAINADSILNLWVIDMSDTSILGFANFPWEVMDNYHGVIIHRRVFFPEDYGETNFGLYKTLTHEVGHYLGLTHVFNQNSCTSANADININADMEQGIQPVVQNVEDYDKILTSADPTDKIVNRSLHYDAQYNPLFMDYMDGTYDRYVAIFTNNQIQKMRYMTMTFRPKINSITNRVLLPIPKYDPDSDTITGEINYQYNVAPIPSYETVTNPRLNAQSFQPHPTCPTIEDRIPISSNSNADILKLIPNLSSNNGALLGANNQSKEQIIANIQNNLPIDPNHPVTSSINLVQEHQQYTSDNAYVQNYPYDPYVTHYQQYMSASQNNTDSIPQSELDPRLTGFSDSKQPILPNTPYPERMPPQVFDPRLTGYPYYPYPYGMPYGYPIPHKSSKKHKSKKHKHNTLTDQINSEIGKINHEMQYVDINDNDYEINQEAVEKIRKQLNHNIPRHADMRAPISMEPLTNFTNHQIPIGASTMSISDITSQQTPSDLAKRINRLDENIQNIKSTLPIKSTIPINSTIPTISTTTNTSVNTAKMIAKSSLNENKPKYNKFGQQINPIVASPNVSNMNNPRAPRKKFVRTKPININ